MGTSRSPAELAGKFAQMQTGLVGAQRKGVTAGSLLIATEARREVARATRGSSRLSGVGKTGARLSVSYDVKGTAREPVGLVRAVGPWQLIERDTSPHTILPRGVGRAKGRSKVARRAAKQSLYDALFGNSGFAGAKPLSLPWGPRFRVVHKGTKGKHPWEKAVDRTAPRVLPVVRAETHAAMVKAFR